jgi:hypothetical protein
LSILRKSHLSISESVTLSNNFKTLSLPIETVFETLEVLAVGALLILSLLLSTLFDHPQGAVQPVKAAVNAIAEAFNQRLFFIIYR